MLKIENFNWNFGGVIVGRYDIFYDAMDLLGNKSLETHSTRSENSLKKNLVSKIFRVSKITTLFFLWWGNKLDSLFPE